MKDLEIRNLLLNNILLDHLSDPHTKVVYEFSLEAARSRADIAVINGHFHGYEIKGSNDSLVRLDSQIKAYTKIFEYITLVTEQKHLQKAKDLLPEYVGILLVNQDGKISEERKSILNDQVDGFYIAHLLWREEMVQYLKSEQVKFNSGHSKRRLSQLIDNKFCIEEISESVRSKIKSRADWRTSVTAGYAIM